MATIETVTRTINGTDNPTYSFLERKYGKAVLRPSELAAECGSHPTRIRKLCADGVIHAVKVGGNRWAIPLYAAADFLEGGADHE